MKDTKTYSAIKSISIGLAISFILSILLILVFSWIIFIGPIPESASGIIVLAISLLSIFIGSIVCAKMKKRRGLIFGTILAALYFSILYITSCFLGIRADFAPASVSVILFGIIIGAIGGIIGVNTAKK